MHVHSRRTVPQEPRLHRATFQPHCMHHLWISRNKINGLVTEFHILAFDIEYDSLHGLLRR